MSNNFRSKKQFQSFHTLNWREETSKKIRGKYKNKIPCIVFPFENVAGNPPIDKTQFLVQKEVLLGSFLQVIKKRLVMKPSDALFLFIDKKIPIMTKSLGEIYEEMADVDGFLYIEYSIESTFGG